MEPRNLRTLELSCVLLAALACSHAVSTQLPGSGDVAQLSASDVVPPGSILWAAARRLSWSDFLGVPQIGSAHAAVTGYVLVYSAECDADVFTYRAEAAFVPRQSWVKPDIPIFGSASRRTLQHEQTHFDLAEVDARRIRQALSELASPCRMPSDERNAIVTRLIQEDGEVQQRYDRETANGTDREWQTEWETFVARRLASLRRYAK